MTYSKDINKENEITAKEDIFRSDNDSNYYMGILKNLGLLN